MTLWLFIGINKCALAPAICGHGKCVPVQTGYTCQCEPGFKLSALQTNCIGECQRGYVSFVHPRSKMSMLKHHKMKKIRLFMLTCSVMLDNSTVAIQKAATLQCSLTSWWRPWLCIASAGLQPTLIGFKFPTLEINSAGIECCLEFDAFSFCPPLSLSVSCCRCKRVWRWPVRREGSLHQLLRFLHLSVSQWLQPGDHAEQEVLSRWVTLNDSNGHDFRKTTQTALYFLLGHLKILSVNTIQ